MQKRRPVMLMVLDGWGWREEAADNAVRQARTPNFDRLWATCPHAFLHTSGQDVGLPAGQMGNSEVGHLNIGAGRLVLLTGRVGRGGGGRGIGGGAGRVGCQRRIGGCRRRGVGPRLGGVLSGERYRAQQDRKKGESGGSVWESNPPEPPKASPSRF